MASEVDFRLAAEIFPPTKINEPMLFGLIAGAAAGDGVFAIGNAYVASVRPYVTTDPPRPAGF